MLKKLFQNQRFISALLSLIILIGAAFSVFWAAPKFSDPENRIETLQYLNEKRNTVLKLATASTSASTVLTLLPDDAATPIANELAELSIYFMIITAAIMLEKYLVTVSAWIVLRWFVPVLAFMLLLYIWGGFVQLGNLAVKISVFGLILVLLVPASVKICTLIEDTYDTSIQAAINSAQETADLINSSNEEEKNAIAKFLTGAASAISTAFNAITNILNNFIEAVAIMIITSCVIPILIVIAFVWVINTIFGTNFSLPAKRVKVDTQKIKNSFTNNNE